MNKKKLKAETNSESTEASEKVTDDVTLISDIKTKIDLSDENLSSYTDDAWIRYYKLYRNYLDADKWSTKTKIFTPLVYGVIETQTARTMSSKPTGEWKPSVNGARGDAEKMQMAFDAWWREERAVIKSQDVFKKTLLYGSAAAQIYWKYEQGFKLGKPFIRTNRPSIRVLRMEDKLFGFDPNAESFEDCEWAFIRYGMTLQELKNLKSSPTQGLYKNLDEAIKDFADDEFEKDGMLRERREILDAKKVKDTTTDKVECVYLENYDTGECTTLIGRKHIIMSKKNPYLIDRQLLMTNNIRVPSEVLGMSDVEAIETLQHGANLFRNQRADSIDAALHPKWVVKGETVDDEEIIDDDCLIVHTDELGDVKPLVKENVAGAAFKEDEVIKNDIYAASSITPFSMGNDNDVKGDRSGKAIARLQDASDARIKAKLMNFEINFIKEIAEKWQRLMAQYQEDNIIIYDGDEEIVITPEDLGGGNLGESEKHGEWDYYVETGSTQHISDVESREDYINYQDSLITLAKLKEESQAIPELPQGGMPVGGGGGMAEGLPPVLGAVDGGMPAMGQMPQENKTTPLNYDKMAEKLSEKFNIKDWREIWNTEDKDEEIPEEQQQELLPPVNDDLLGAMTEQPQQELLPPITEPQETAPQEIAPIEGLPPVAEDSPSLIQKFKAFLGKKGKGKESKGKELLPPVR